MTSSYEDQGTGYDPGAAGHERQGRASRPQHTDGDVTDERADLLAQTMCAAYWRDMAPSGQAPIWNNLPVQTKGNWRRAARAAMRTLAGNRHWLEASRALLEERE